MFEKLFVLFLQKTFYIRHLNWLIKGRKAYKSLDKNKFYVICPFGIGDLCFSVKAMKIKYPEKKIVFITRSAEKMLEPLLDGAELLADSKFSKSLIRYIEIFSKYNGSNYFYANFPRDKAPSLRWGYYDKKDKTNFWDDLCTDVYGIPAGSLKNCAEKSVGKSSVSLGKKDIILFPDANTVEPIPADFWVDVSRMLQDKGYTVYTNTVKNDDLIQGTQPLKLPLDEICIAAEQCGGCIALRSGICDLLAIHSYAKLFVINSDDLWSKYGSVTYFRNFDIYDLFYESKEDMTELILKYF